MAGIGRETAWTEAVLTEQSTCRGAIARRAAPRDRAVLRRTMVDARTALEDAALAAALAAQRALSAAAALDEALAGFEATEGSGVSMRSSPAAPGEIVDDLSPREREVLALVAEGRTNTSSAEALYVSTNTIRTCVASLLYKLQADTRVQLAAMAARGALR